MPRLFVALGTGILFGVGLAVSNMVNPAKVLGFLDVTGSWDPSLILVMAGALAVTSLTFPRILRQSGPILDSAFIVAAKSQIDTRLIGGSVIFGVGWGLVGLCPGPAVAALAYGNLEPAIFLVAMLAGMWLYRVIPNASGLSTAG